MFVVSQKWQKGGKGKEAENRKWGRTERRFLLLSLHTFNLLLPSALANSVHYRALTPPCSALSGCSPFDNESCLPLQSGRLGSHSLIVEEIFVPCLNLCTCACLPAQLSQLAACGSVALHNSPEGPNAWTGTRAPMLHGGQTKFIQVHELPFEKWDVGVKGLNTSCCHVS